MGLQQAGLYLLGERAEADERVWVSIQSGQRTRGLHSSTFWGWELLL